MGTITFGGTLFLVVFFGASAAIAGGARYAVMRPWLSRAGRWRGLSFGAVLFVLIGSTIIDDAIQITLGRYSAEMVGAAAAGALLMMLIVVVVATGGRLPRVAIYGVFGLALVACVV